MDDRILIDRHEVTGTIHVYHGSSSSELLALIGGEQAALDGPETIEGTATYISSDSEPAA